MTKFVCISDTHNIPLSELALPEGDFLLHAGDCTNYGRINEIAALNREFGEVKDRYTHGVFLTPGNHDFIFEQNEKLARQLLPNATVLIGESFEVGGFKLYGDPHQPRFYDWAFNADRHGEKLQKCWDNIPEDTDVLITHGPPYGVLDFVPNGDGHVGCELLKKRVLRLNLKLHVFGHIHMGYGTVQDGQYTTFVNASIAGIDKNNSPIVVEL